MFHDPVAIIAVLSVFGFPTVIVSLWLKFSQQRSQLHTQVLLKLVESGQPIPPELLTPRKAALVSDPKVAIVWTAIGAGLIIYGAINTQRWIWAAGFIPLLVGLGLLLAWRIERRGKSEATELDRPSSFRP